LDLVAGKWIVNVSSATNTEGDGAQLADLLRAPFSTMWITDDRGVTLDIQALGATPTVGMSWTIATAKTITTPSTLNWFANSDASQ
jgi:hypothetical protein